ncbi:MAG: SEL1-like repeat protein [Treponema sp.]|nr:SEL1-like repeat protein [Treponema sp.]
MKLCRQCGIKYESGKFCQECGSPLEGMAEKTVCKNCGAELPDGAKFCADCGTPVTSNETAAVEKQNEDTPFDKNDIKSIQKAAIQGDAEAQYLLGSYYYRGKSTRLDYSTADIHNRAIIWLEISSMQGNDKAQYLLGKCYYEGTITEESTARAHEWLVKSSKQGNAAAQYLLGRIYFFGGGAIEQNHSKAMDLFKKSAEQGNADAQEMVARLSKRNNGISI